MSSTAFGQTLGENRTIDGIEYRLLTIEDWGEVARMAVEVERLRTTVSLLQQQVDNYKILNRVSEKQLTECNQYRWEVETDLKATIGNLDDSHRRVKRLRLWSYVPWIAMAIGGIVVSSVALSN